MGCIIIMYKYDWNKAIGSHSALLARHIHFMSFSESACHLVNVPHSSMT